MADGAAAQISGVSKRFVANQALDDVDFDVRGGEIHALIGGNGSGKSTLIKILAGVYTADTGLLRTRGQEIDLRSATPAGADAAGFRFVHQAQSTFRDLTVSENLSIGRGFETGPLGNVRERLVRERTEEVLARFGIEARPAALVRSLGPAAQAMLAIARALQDQDEQQANVLVLDEPTAALPPAEVDVLLSALRRYAQEGTAVVLVSHRLDEVMAVADRVTALRDGRRVATLQRSALTHDGLIELIAGRAIAPHVRAVAIEDQRRATVLDAQALTGGKIRDVSFSVAEGEIVGLTGLAGAGTSTLLRLLFGAQRLESGSFSIDGRPVPGGRTKASIAAGIVLVPGDRAAYGVFDSLTVSENLVAASVGRYWRGGWMRTRSERRDALEAFRRFMIRASSPAQPVSQLSGGNQQKVVFARWLSEAGRRLILLDEPTQGVDVGAKEELWSIVRRAAQGGAGVVVASSDLEELAGVCDRVLVIRRGRLVEQVTQQPLTVDRLIDRVHAVEVSS